MNRIMPDYDVKRDTGANLAAESDIDAEHDFNLDFDIRLNMARAMVKVLNDMDLVDCFTSVSARSMRNEDDKVAYMAMREELLRRMQNEDK